ncbi:MAG: LemA family protein [Planctomycetes bacterium]|nr:LemA family protein [Planctomycetota bacterium]MCH8211898.1 LemA family protein [Planctomycetota bacterium]MCH8259810.1 LemA family protein [Planctomycetota bacterium]
MVTTLIILGVLVVAAIFVIGLYNGLVRKKAAADGAWSDIDVQLKRRYNLIPNLVETVKGYASHERETLESVIKARQTAIDVSGIAGQAQAENMLSGALRQLFALSESYPDLKANQNFMQLQEELASTENKIGFARQHYNRSAVQYNTAIEVFPANMIAGRFNFDKMEYFELEDTAQREAPKVSF